MNSTLERNNGGSGLYADQHTEARQLRQLLADRDREIAEKNERIAFLDQSVHYNSGWVYRNNKIMEQVVLAALATIAHDCSDPDAAQIAQQAGALIAGYLNQGPEEGRIEPWIY